MTMVVGASCSLAQLAATLVFADTGPLPSRIVLYADAAVATGAAPADAPLADIELATPCGTLAGGNLTLHPALATGSMVTVGGTPRAARWVNGDGDLVVAGTVTDLANGGFFRVGGALTAPGETSPAFYAGGLVLLGAVVLD